MTQNSIEDFQVFVSDDRWTPWFCDVAWDRTWIMADRARHEVTVICLTDTD